MSYLTLLAPFSPSNMRPALAHDIRDAMAVIALNVERLEHLAGSAGVKAAAAAHLRHSRRSTAQRPDPSGSVPRLARADDFRWV